LLRVVAVVERVLAHLLSNEAAKSLLVDVTVASSMGAVVVVVVVETEVIRAFALCEATRRAKAENIFHKVFFCCKREEFFGFSRIFLNEPFPCEWEKLPISLGKKKLPILKHSSNARTESIKYAARHDRYALEEKKRSIAHLVSRD